MVNILLLFIKENISNILIQEEMIQEIYIGPTRNIPDKAWSIFGGSATSGNVHGKHPAVCSDHV